MVTRRGPWSESEIRNFLEEVTIPLRLAVTKPDGSLWIVALWFRYQDDYLECATGANADLVRFLEANQRVGFDVSTNEVPYRGIRGSGHVSLTPDTQLDLLRSLIRRYLGDTESTLAQQLLMTERDEVRIRIKPEAIFSWDFSKRMRDVSAA